MATKAAQQRAEELERLVAFGQALGRVLDVVDGELRRARRSQTPVSLIMFEPS